MLRLLKIKDINPFFIKIRFNFFTKKTSLQSLIILICIVKYRSNGKAVVKLKLGFRGPGFKFGGLKLEIFIFPDRKKLKTKGYPTARMPFIF